jgi:hypothetical protein
VRITCDIDDEHFADNAILSLTQGRSDYGRYDRN